MPGKLIALFREPCVEATGGKEKLSQTMSFAFGANLRKAKRARKVEVDPCDRLQAYIDKLEGAVITMREVLIQFDREYDDLQCRYVKEVRRGKSIVCALQAHADDV